MKWLLLIWVWQPSNSDALAFWPTSFDDLKTCQVQAEEVERQLDSHRAYTYCIEQK